MSILIYGGGFNPPHLGHVAALNSAVSSLAPNRVLVIPDGTPPHKPLPEGTPDSEARLALCRLAFRDVDRAEVLDLAIRRDGPCYMIDTLRLLREQYPTESLILLLGSDMLLCLEQWYCAEEIMRMCAVAALCRSAEERESIERKAEALRARYGAEILLLEHEPIPVSSSQIRALLPQRQGSGLLDGAVYREVIRRRLYGAKPELAWLREQVYGMLNPRRVPHVVGCEQEARLLAQRWGIDPETAAEAGILHDMTKRWTAEEQLRYCAEKGIVLDDAERHNPQLLHARTGAVAAKELFGAPDEICDAIRWHTTGKPEMNLFEKILYLADMIEPKRDFPGVAQLRTLAYEDLESAMAEALRLSVESIRQRNLYVYKDTLEAYRWYSFRAEENKEEEIC